MSFEQKNQNVGFKQSTKHSGIYNAGRILVVGSQGGGKTALATKVSAYTGSAVEYEEEFGGTIETEYLRVTYNDGKLFSLLLPIGGQEKWASLRTQYGETAEGIIVIQDSLTKAFWPNSLKQAEEISPMVPYENFPIACIITKQDQNKLIQKEAPKFAEVIFHGIKQALINGFDYWARGFKIIQRHNDVIGNQIPFSQFEQIAVNAMENAFFTDLVPGNAKKGKRLLTGFSLVNCRLFGRALTTALGRGGGVDQGAVLSLLNEMRPTLLELDTDWNALLKKYPNAGPEPYVPSDITEKEIEDAIRNKLLATTEDIVELVKQLKKMSESTNWKPIGIVHASVFTDDGLDEITDFIKELLNNIGDAKPSPKFGLLEPLEEIF